MVIVEGASMKKLAFALAAAFTLAACSASTAHISALGTYKDQDMKTATDTYAPTDDVYAGGHVANLPNKVTMQWQTIAEDVEGQPKDAHIDALDKSYDAASDADVSYHLSPPTKGWPKGKYKIVLTMMDNGTQRDQKSTEFTVK